MALENLNSQNSNLPLSLHLPHAEGLYHPQYEHDACGLGFICHLKNVKSHAIVTDAIQLLENLNHRGASAEEKNSGDGAGILVQIPHDFFLAQKLSFTLPQEGDYAIGQFFLPKQTDHRGKIISIIEKCIQKYGQNVLGWRQIPVRSDILGKSTAEYEPYMAQLFIQKNNAIQDKLAFDRKLYVIRKSIENTVCSLGAEYTSWVYISSLSCRTITYKGRLTAKQVRPYYYADLFDENFTSALALVHSRFATNTFPLWPLAQPFRFLAHNGEINTLQGNVNWMKAREHLIASPFFSQEEVDELKSVIDKQASDSACLDSVVELLNLTGYDLAHVMMMLIPEAWKKDSDMPAFKRDFYNYHASVMEPWDGPASIAFTNGEQIGATLDRNGLRPSRYCLTSDDILIMASEAGAVSVDERKVISKGRLQSGRMFLIDLQKGKIITDEELKKQIALKHPYGEWLKKNRSHFSFCFEEKDFKLSKHMEEDATALLQKQLLFGYNTEDLKFILGPMMDTGQEGLGSMGSDTPLAVLSHKSQNLYNYFYQRFAQVTNPPIDPIREESIMSLMTLLGRKESLFSNNKDDFHVLQLEQPILLEQDVAHLESLSDFSVKRLSTCFPAEKDKKDVLEKALSFLQEEALLAVEKGAEILILSDKLAGKDALAIPSLLAISAIHHNLIKAHKRMKCSIVVEAADVREVHHFVLLLGYGASAISPYLALRSINTVRQQKWIKPEVTNERAAKNYVKAINKGILKVMSKIGVSMVQSYIGAQIFEAVGLSDHILNTYFSGTISMLGGIGLAEIEKDLFDRHWTAYCNDEENLEALSMEDGGQYAWRARGETHLFNPDTIATLQHACLQNDYELYKEYANKINQQDENFVTLRSLFNLDTTNSIPLSEVEPIENIFKRFVTGAMSFGSISWEAHTTLAVAMNRIGGKSNTGEGGEDTIRFKPLANGDSMRSAIKQVASGRFGVTSYYLANADELQIKIAQGAKPGEGGQLPGHKVDEIIGKTRYSTPGVGLISPPPHHDIYSIEDLAQLIFDLKNANRKARISVKLVSEAGVGTIAAGVTKAYADVVIIAGNDGGTGAASLTSIKHAGLPWELGLAETHQTLVKNGLRDRIVVQTDGQVKTGKDVVIATLLGAEEWGVATAALISAGCIMMRKCHLNTCPVGIATQNEELRKLFTGKPEHVINLFTFMATEIRELMAALGFRSINEMVGCVDKLKPKQNIAHWKAKHLDLGRLLYKMSNKEKINNQYCCRAQANVLEEVLDNHLIAEAKDFLINKKKFKKNITVTNTDRALGTMLSYEINQMHGEGNLDDDSLWYVVKGSLGQSFSAFGVRGLTFEIEGEANDYFGKGLSGAKLILYPPRESQFLSHKNVIVGNVAFYGATSGEAYIAGMAGERFCVRNSGVEVVVEAVGDHGCEYMTGGKVVILGSIGKNFAAGMSGGIAYILNVNNQLQKYINVSMVDIELLTQDDTDYIKQAIEDHFKYTQSKHSAQLLADWQNTAAQFIKVMPQDYKKILQKKQLESS